MNADAILKFVLNQPFEPFEIHLADGREILVMHPELVGIGRYALSMRLMDLAGRVELIDADMIVSL